MKEFIDGLSEKDAAAAVAAMEEVQIEGLRAARHLTGQIYEVRVDGTRVIYRILFAPQGRRSQVLLTLVALNKKTRKTPPQAIRLAKKRLRDWEDRGRKSSVLYQLWYLTFDIDYGGEKWITSLMPSKN